MPKADKEPRQIGMPLSYADECDIINLSSTWFECCQRPVYRKRNYYMQTHTEEIKETIKQVDKKADKMLRILERRPLPSWKAENIRQKSKRKVESAKQTGSVEATVLQDQDDITILCSRETPSNFGVESRTGFLVPASNPVQNEKQESKRRRIKNNTTTKIQVHASDEASASTSVNSTGMVIIVNPTSRMGLDFMPQYSESHETDQCMQNDNAMEWEHSTPPEEHSDDNAGNGKNEGLGNASQSMFKRLLIELNLKKYYPQKLTLMDAIKIKDIEHLDTMTRIPWIFLHNLMMNNYKARDVLIDKHLHTDEESDWNNSDLREEDPQNELLKINPLDLMLVIFECCSYELKQVLANKLFLCRLACPLVNPTQPFKCPVVNLWSIFSVVITHGSRQISAFDCPCHVVSFVRFGELAASISKSKILNQLLSDQYHDTFYNSDCPLGTNERLVSEGMVEAAWQLSSQDSDNVRMFLNLRGDGLNLDRQLNFLSQISSAIVVMLDIKHLDVTASRRVLRSLHECSFGLVFCIDASHHKKDTTVINTWQRYLKENKLNQKKTKICKLALNGKSASSSNLKNDLAKKISEVTSGGKTISLKDLLQNKQISLFSTDLELVRKLRLANKKATQVFGTMPSICEDFKECVVPLQGKLWQNISEQSKVLSQARTITKIEMSKDKLKRYRTYQVNAIRNQHEMMKLFVKYLTGKGQSTNDRILFITCLKLYFDEWSRNIRPKFLSLYQKALKEMKTANEKLETKFQDQQTRLKTAERDLADASFGLEHLLRECGQIYETIMECMDKTSKSMKVMATTLSKACAKQILLGVPFEILDGDTLNVPMRWVKAVLGELKRLIGDKKLLSVSVLGIQSSGKSTLLNTMFGLQFAVNASRCTRGVFMQLIPVDNEGTKFDYVLVIDTEGLRAPELAHEKHDHDNMLATFVIGLGDITIINIKGHIVQEMREILQIAVLAFLRLKLANATLNLKQSCVFVHHNVSAVDANDQMMHERQKLVEHLDEMTENAAKQVLITNIQSFNQVIEFDSESDVWYFPDLWIGNPPMAPTNPQYSKMSYEVKNAIMVKLTKSRDTFLTITDTITRIEDLWNGIITDDFVFAFRNSLEVKAYSSMEKQFQDVRFSANNFFVEFILNTAKVQIENCNCERDLPNVVNKLTLLLRQQAEMKFLTLQKQLESFVNESELKDIMVKWINTKKMRLQTLRESLLATTESDVLKIRKEKLMKFRYEVEKIRYETKINERAQQLANTFLQCGQRADNDQMNKVFNDMWMTLFEEFSTTIDNTYDNIQEQIECLVLEKFHEINVYLSTQKSNKQYPNVSQLKDVISNNDLKEDEHFEVHKSLFEKVSDFAIEKDEMIFKRQLTEIADVIFRRIETKLDEITKQDIQFNIMFVNDILEIIVFNFDEHNNQYAATKKFSILPPFKALIISHVLPYMTKVFTRHNEEYKQRHSLKTELEKYKTTALELFKNVVNDKSEEIIAASLFHKAIEVRVVNHVTELIHHDVQAILRSRISNNKFGMMKRVMEYLAETEDFLECKRYILDPANFVEQWLTTQMHNLIFNKSHNGSSEYARLAKHHIVMIFKEIDKSINTATLKCTTTSIHSSEFWIKQFTDSLYQSKVLPLSTGTFVHVEQRQVKDIENFNLVVQDQLKETKKKVLERFSAFQSNTVLWTEHPITKMMDDLWGCKEKCPFCFEPCKYTDSNHLDTETKHECIQHRLIALNGTPWYKTQNFALLFCNNNVQGDLVYIKIRKEGVETKRRYRDYQEEYPNWYIEPNPEKAKYWMWLLCKYQKEFERSYNLEFQDIPESWRHISREDAIESVKE